MNKQDLAKEVLENELFQFIFETMFNDIREKIEYLAPHQKEEFSLLQAQKIIVSDIYNTFISSSKDEGESKPQGNVIL